MKLAASCGLIRIHLIFLYERNLMSSLAGKVHKDTF